MKGRVICVPVMNNGDKKKSKTSILISSLTTQKSW